MRLSGASKSAHPAALLLPQAVRRLACPTPAPAPPRANLAGIPLPSRTRVQGSLALTRASGLPRGGTEAAGRACSRRPTICLQRLAHDRCIDIPSAALSHPASTHRSPPGMHGASPPRPLAMALVALASSGFEPRDPRNAVELRVGGEDASGTAMVAARPQ